MLMSAVCVHNADFGLDLLCACAPRATETR